MKKKIAVVCANGLGDGLLSLIITQNFFLSGYKVITFSNALQGLLSWFPQHTILPFPSIDYEKAFSQFDQVISADHSILANQTLPGIPFTLLREIEFDKKKTLVENLSEICRTRFFLPYSQKSNGITIPQGIQHRHFPERVIIHPMSLEEKRCWPAEKFLKVAEKLFEKGLKPAICTSLSERKEWSSFMKKRPHIAFPLFLSTAELASYIYESGWLIGNNSGLGHLASNLGIPTLSLFARQSYANLWRPGWGPGLVVTPLKIYPGAGIMNKCWKTFLSTTMVLRKFKKLQKNQGTIV